MIAKNMANSQVVSGSEQDAYRAQRPVFATILNSSLGAMNSNQSRPMNSGYGNQISGVQIKSTAESQSPIERQRMPGNPMADEDGYIYMSNVNMIEEMAYMMQASRSYQSNIEVMNTSKQLMLRTLSLGNS